MLAYLPPTAPLCMPMLIAMGEASPGDRARVAAWSWVSLVARVAGAIYSNAILRTGKTVKWLEARVRTPSSIRARPGIDALRRVAPEARLAHVVRRLEDDVDERRAGG